MPYLLHHLLDRTAARLPRKEAVVDKERRFDYAELLAAAETCAGALREGGLRRRDRVAIFLDMSFEEAAASFGISRAGGGFVPVHALLKPAPVLPQRDVLLNVLKGDGRREGDETAVDDIALVLPVRGLERAGELLNSVGRRRHLERERRKPLRSRKDCSDVEGALVLRTDHKRLLWVVGKRSAIEPLGSTRDRRAEAESGGECRRLFLTVAVFISKPDGDRAVSPDE